MFCSVVLNVLAVNYIDESNKSMIIEMTKMTKTMLGRGNYLYYIYDKTKKTNQIFFGILLYSNRGYYIFKQLTYSV